MPPDRRLLREIRQAYGTMHDYQLLAGQWAQWFRFDTADTTVHPVYDTGPQRVWYPSVTVPVLFGQYERASQNFDDDGMYLVDQLHLVISYMQFIQSLVPDPDPNGNDHINDRVGFDGHLFKVTSFIPRGRVASHFLTISCDLIEVASSEMAEDVPSPMFSGYLTTT